MLKALFRGVLKLLIAGILIFVRELLLWGLQFAADRDVLGLMHWPAPMTKDEKADKSIDWRDTWRAMEKVYTENRSTVKCKSTWMRLLGYRISPYKNQQSEYRTSPFHT